jgi:DNA replication protein DnaC
MDVALSVIDRIGKGIDPAFALTPNVEEIYKELIRYFHADPDFKGDLTKGLLLQGPTGTGKTLAMQVMSVYRQIDDTKFIMKGKTYRMNYEVVDVNQMINMFMNNAFDGIQVYCNRYVLCIDDIGVETDQVKHYGNTLDVVSHVLSERYSKRLLTFATTNFPTHILEDKYDDRTVSRMYALFNFITMKGKDFRKT